MLDSSFPGSRARNQRAAVDAGQGEGARHGTQLCLEDTDQPAHAVRARSARAVRFVSTLVAYGGGLVGDSAVVVAGVSPSGTVGVLGGGDTGAGAGAGVAGAGFGAGL